MDRLIESENFSTTHRAIAKLIPFIGALTKDDVHSLADAAVGNQQIKRIADDIDVYDFFRKIITPYFDSLDAHTQSAVDSLFHIKTPKSDPDLDEETSF